MEPSVLAVFPEPSQQPSEAGIFKPHSQRRILRL